MSQISLLKTPLYQMHIEANARMVPFAGFEMPVQYPLGVLKEHLHCRAQAGLFDVSHMGQICLMGQPLSIIAKALEKLVPVDILNLPVNKQKYALFTNEQAGILDDLMVANLGDHLFLVVNAACKQQDIDHLTTHLANEHIKVNPLIDRALLALQGPKAVDVLTRLNPEITAMSFMSIQHMTLLGCPCIISRSGYTGEDGFEISIHNNDAPKIAQALLSETEVEWIGLGARDSLRLESGLCLYGHDLTIETTPYEANLLWAISPARRSDGERAGGFLGAPILLDQIKHKQANHKRIGLVGQSKAPVREGAILFDADDNEIGSITSGGFGPTYGTPIAMGYIMSEYAIIDQVVYAEVRGKKLPMRISKMPFVPQRYYRG